MRKPLRDKPLLLGMSMALYISLSEHQLREAPTFVCKLLLAESTNSHFPSTNWVEAPTSNLTQHQLGEGTHLQINPAPTGWKHQLPDLTQHQLGGSTNFQFNPAPTGWRHQPSDLTQHQLGEGTNLQLCKNPLADRDLKSPLAPPYHP